MVIVGVLVKRSYTVIVGVFVKRCSTTLSWVSLQRVERAGFFRVYCIAPNHGAGILAANLKIGKNTCFQKPLQTS